MRLQTMLRRVGEGRYSPGSCRKWIKENLLIILKGLSKVGTISSVSSGFREVPFPMNILEGKNTIKYSICSPNGREKLQKCYSAVRRIKVVAPMVMIAPSSMRTRSLSPNNSLLKNVPVKLGASRRV